MIRDASDITNISPKLFIKSSITDRIEIILKDLILGGELNFGDRINIDALSRRFHISKTPIRESLQRLAYKGPVEFRPRVGFFVTKYTKKKIEELFSLREMVEIGALGDAILHFSDEELRVFESFTHDVIKKSDDGNDPSGDLLKTDLHQAIIRKSDNSYLTGVFSQVYFQIRFLSIIASQEDSVREHADIVLAIKQRDLKTASSLLRSHIRATKDKLMEMIRE